jgi:polyisoprenoid-binding protein YceI
MTMTKLNLHMKNTGVTVRSTRTLAGMVGALAVVAMVAGCAPGGSDAPAKEAKSETADKPVAAAKESASTASGTLSLSPGNTSIDFLGEKLVGSHEGKFTDFSGSVAFKDGDPLTAKISVKIDMASVKTDTEKLDGHLQSADFFDVPNHPFGTFESTGVRAGGQGAATHTVEGNLTLRGVTKSIAIPAQIEVGEKNVSVKAEFSINRQDYGISFPGMPDNLIKDDVKIFLKIDGNI